MDENIGQILDQYKAVIDEREALATRDSELAKLKAALERQMLDHSEQSGVTQFANDFISVSVSDANRATYAPEQWDGIVKWAAETGNLNLIHRRLSDAKVVALIEEGIALPDGLGIEPYKKLSYRRK